MTKESYTLDECEAALCVWEHLLSMREGHDIEDDDDPTNPDGFQRCWVEFGVSIIRFVCITELAPWVNEVWRELHHAQDSNVDWDIRFDLEFVPRVIDFVDWSIDEEKDGVRTIKPTIEEAAKRYRDEFSDVERVVL